MHKKKLGFIAFGKRGAILARDCAKELGDFFEPAAAADPDTAGAKERMKKIGLSLPVYSTPEEMIENSDHLDALFISTPEDCHLESFRAIAKTGLPLLMEKPLEGDLERFAILTREMREYDAPVMIGHCMRHAPILRRARQFIDEGWLGKITSMRFVQNCCYGEQMFRGWRRRSDKVTSMYVEKSTHDFDIMHMMNGDAFATGVFAFSRQAKFGGDKPNDLKCKDCPEQLSCSESILNHNETVYGRELDLTGQDYCVYAQEADVGDDEMCMIEFANGVQGSYAQTFFTPLNYTGRIYTVVGTEGVMDINMGHGQGLLTVNQRSAAKSDQLRMTFDYLGHGHYLGDHHMLRNFYEMICGREEPFTTLEAAVAAEALGMAAVKSVKSKQFETVQIP
jgi:predicted dehydrogenase